MNKIKRIVKRLDIPEQRKEYLNNKKYIEEMLRAMEELNGFEEVQQYIFLLHECDTKLAEIKTASYGEIRRLSVIIHKLQDEIKKIEGNKLVSEYKMYRDTYYELKQRNSMYYKTINVGLRQELSFLKLPEIYVYQGVLECNTHYKLLRHIIVPNKVVYYRDMPATIISPVDDIESKKKTRHFYNRVSFKYLDQLAEDGTFDVKVKKLGKVTYNK